MTTKNEKRCDRSIAPGPLQGAPSRRQRLEMILVRLVVAQNKRPIQNSGRRNNNKNSISRNSKGATTNSENILGSRGHHYHVQDHLARVVQAMIGSVPGLVEPLVRNDQGRRFGNIVHHVQFQQTVLPKHFFLDTLGASHQRQKGSGTQQRDKLLRVAVVLVVGFAVLDRFQALLFLVNLFGGKIVQSHVDLLQCKTNGAAFRVGLVVVNNELVIVDD